MTRPTHSLNWDVILPLGGKPVLFADFILECSVEEGCSDHYVQACNLIMDTGVNTKTGEIENEILLEVPSDHMVSEMLIKTIKEENLNKTFDLLFAYMVSLSLRKDEVLYEKIN